MDFFRLRPVPKYRFEHFFQKNFAKKYPAIPPVCAAHRFRRWFLLRLSGWACCHLQKMYRCNPVLPEHSGTLPKGHWQIICTWASAPSLRLNSGAATHDLKRLHCWQKKWISVWMPSYFPIRRLLRYQKPLQISLQERVKRKYRSTFPSASRQMHLRLTSKRRLFGIIRQPPFTCKECAFTFGGQPLRIVRVLRDRNR